MDSKVLHSHKPIHLKYALTGIVNGNCQSYHVVCVQNVYICLEEAGMKDRVAVDDSENEEGWNKQGSDYSFSPPNKPTLWGTHISLMKG